MEFERMSFENGQLRPRPGRPSKLNIRLARLIFFLAEKGLTDAEIAHVVDIDEATLHRWKKSEAFCKSLTLAKEKPNHLVTEALLKKALGMLVTSVTTETDDAGKTLRIRTVTREVPPDPGACQFWLCNRRPDKWRFTPDRLTTAEKSTEAAQTFDLPRQSQVDVFREEMRKEFEKAFPPESQSHES